MSPNLGQYGYCEYRGCFDAYTEGVRSDIGRLQEERADQRGEIGALGADIKQMEERISRRRRELRALETRLERLRLLNRTTEGNVQISRALAQDLKDLLVELTGMLNRPPLGPAPIEPPEPGDSPGTGAAPSDAIECMRQESTDLIALLRDLSREIIVPSDPWDVVLIGAGVIGQFIRASRRARALLQLIDAINKGHDTYTAFTRERVCPTK